MNRPVLRRWLPLAVAAGILTLAGGAVISQTSSLEEEPSLYERLGGLAPISLVVSDFVDVFIQDSVIMANPAVREQKTAARAPYVKYQVTSMVCEATGGPCQYIGSNMKEAHEGLNVSEGEWERMGAIFVEVLERHGVPRREQEELLALIGSTRDDIVASRR